MNLRVIGFSLLVVAICYANSVPYPFVQADDWLIVAGNQGIRSVAPLRFLSEPYWAGYKFGGIYRPLTIFSFSIDYALWERWAPGYRLTNLLLHAANGCLVFLLASTLIGFAGAWAASALYLIHPVHTEAIVGIVGRAELLAAAFFFSAWLMFRRGRMVWATVLFFLSLLSKENAIVFPAIAALDVLLLDGGPHKLRAIWRRFAVLGMAAVAYLLLRFSVLGQLGIPAASQYMHGRGTLIDRWMTSGRAFVQYFRLAFLPIDVAGNYEFNSIHIAHVGDWDAWAGLTIIFGVLVTATFAARKYPAVALALLFFFVTLLPVSNWIMPISVVLAERFLYMPIFAIALLAAVTWKVISTRLRYVIGTGVFVTAVLLCISHNWTWQNEYTLYTNMVRVTPDNLSARLGYGLVLQNSGRVEQAKEQFEAGLRIDPDSPPLLTGLAGLFVQSDPRNCERARLLLDRAFRAEPNYWQASWIQANCYALKGQPEDADAAYRRAVENAPMVDANLLFSWGITLEKLGKRTAAIDVYRRAAVIRPDDKEIQGKLITLAVPH